jgi:hypothetical protein
MFRQVEGDGSRRFEFRRFRIRYERISIPFQSRAGAPVARTGLTRVPPIQHDLSALAAAQDLEALEQAVRRLRPGNGAARLWNRPEEGPSLDGPWRGGYANAIDSGNAAGSRRSGSMRHVLA